VNRLENIIGTAFADTLTGSLRSNRIEGGDGDDRLFPRSEERGRDGNNLLDGGAGADTVYYLFTGAVSGRLAGVLTIHGSGKDSLTDIEHFEGSEFGDTITGTAADNTFVMRGGRDVANGGHGTDYLVGGDGNDRLNGGHGDDTLDGDAGNDNLVGDDGADFARGGEGTDRCVVETAQDCED
jgi:Ca2+-binding RTX toxin-like protein